MKAADFANVSEVVAHLITERDKVRFHLTGAKAKKMKTEKYWQGADDYLTYAIDTLLPVVLSPNP